MKISQFLGVIAALTLVVVVVQGKKQLLLTTGNTLRTIDVDGATPGTAKSLTSVLPVNGLQLSQPAVGTDGTLLFGFGRTVEQASTKAFVLQPQTFAGSRDVALDSADGVATSARFGTLRELVRGGDVIYGLDTELHTVRAITADGSVYTVAGAAGCGGNVDGQGTVARFASPSALAVHVDASGVPTLYVTDASATIKKISAIDVAGGTYVGTVETIAGGAGATTEGTGTNAKFALATDLAISSDGSVLYIADGAYILSMGTTVFNVAKVAGDGNQNFQQDAGTTASGLSQSVFTTALTVDPTDDALYFVQECRTGAIIKKATIGADGTATISIFSGSSTIAQCAPVVTGTVTDTFNPGSAQATTGVIGSGQFVITSPGPARALTGTVATPWACAAPDAPFDSAASSAAGDKSGVAISATELLQQSSSKSRASQDATRSIALRVNVDGNRDNAEYDAFSATSLVVVENLCPATGNSFSMPGAPLSQFAALCNDGSVGAVNKLNLVSSGKWTATVPLVISETLSIAPTASFVAKAPVTVTSGVTSSGTIELAGAPVSVGSITLSTSSIYKLLLVGTGNGIITAGGNAAVDGTLVICVDPTYSFPQGASANILAFRDFVGRFSTVFVVVLRSRNAEPASRSLLQANGATVACSNAAGSCVATATGLSGADDDDEVPLVVALIVVSALLFLGVVAALIVLARRRQTSSIAKLNGVMERTEDTTSTTNPEPFGFYEDDDDSFYSSSA